MANGEQENQAIVEAAKAIAKADQAVVEVAKAIVEADQANAEAAKAKAEADQAKGQADQEIKEQAADAAKDKAEKAKAKAEQAKADAEQAKADAEKAKAALGGGLPGMLNRRPGWTPPPGLQRSITVVKKFSGLIFLMALGLVLIWFLYTIAMNLREGGTLLDKLSKPEIARGFITFIIALGTIAIAVILVIAAFEFDAEDGDGGNGKATLEQRDGSLEKRFKMGKEVLTALIGILGTIVGFYFGTGLPTKTPEALKVADAKVEGEPKIEGKIKLSFQVTGGKAPYTYTVTFPAPTTIAPLKGETGDGKVSTPEITIPAKIQPNTDLTPIKIEVTDSDKKTAVQEIKEPKIPIKAKDGAPPKT